MELAFIKIEKSALPTVLALFKEAAERIEKLNVAHWQYWKNPPEEKVRWVTEGIDKGEFFFIKDEVDELIGMVRILEEDLLYWGQQSEKALYVHSLVVKPAFNGKGLGTKILHAIAVTAQNKHCQYLRLDADAKNPKLCQYYERLGFTKVGVKTLPLSNYHLYQKEVS